MDLNKVALAISFIALILTFPLGIAATLLAPKMRDWYGTTSENRLRERISNLKDRLSRSEQQWTFSPAEWLQYRIGIRTTRYFCIIAICLFLATIPLSALLLVMNEHLRELLHRPPMSIRVEKLSILVLQFFPFLGYGVSSVRLYLIWVGYRDHRWMHTFEGRQETSEEILKLSAKLK